MRRPAMPKTVKVGAHVYTVRRVTKAECPDDLGCCRYNELEIRIRKSLKRVKAMEILTHELLHACGYPTLCDKTLTDEEFVDAVAPQFIQVVRDNPELISYLQS